MSYPDCELTRRVRTLEEALVYTRRIVDDQADALALLGRTTEHLRLLVSELRAAQLPPNKYEYQDKVPCTYKPTDPDDIRFHGLEDCHPGDVALELGCTRQEFNAWLARRNG